MYCETVQEVLDPTIMAFRIAEHRDAAGEYLPDGDYLSYGAARVTLPEQASRRLHEQGRRLARRARSATAMAVDPLTGGLWRQGTAIVVRYRKGQCSVSNALRVITEVHEEYAARFGRGFAPLVEEYRMEGAEFALMTLGSMTSTASAVEEARDARRDRQDLQPSGRRWRRRCRLSAWSIVLSASAGIADRCSRRRWACSTAE